MNTGRNWTRRSIEELIDDFLRRRGTPTPTAVRPYVEIYGKSYDTTVQGHHLYLGITGPTNPLDAHGAAADGVVVELVCRYSNNTPVNLAHHCEKTYFPAAPSFSAYSAHRIGYIYYLAQDPNNVGHYFSTCFKITKGQGSSYELPIIGTGESSYTFTTTTRPSHIHSIPSSATTDTYAWAFRAGRYSEYLDAMEAIDTVIKNRIVTPLGAQNGLALLSEYPISDADLKRKYTDISTFQNLTY